MKRKKKISKKDIAAASVALATSASLMGASTFDVANDGLNADTDQKNVIHIEQKVDQKASFVEKIPDIIKCILYVPIWLLINLIIKPVLKLFKEFVLSPTLAFLLEWLILFGLLLIIILLILKLLYPDKKLKELLTKKLIIGVGVSSFLMKVADLILKSRIENYGTYKALFYFLAGLLILSLVLIPKYIKKRREPRLILPKI